MPAVFSLVFIHFGVQPKIQEFRISLCFSVRRAFWIVLGPLWASCWSHFGVIVISISVFFRRLSMICPICLKCALVLCASIGELCFYPQFGCSLQGGLQRKSETVCWAYWFWSMLVLEHNAWNQCLWNIMINDWATKRFSNRMLPQHNGCENHDVFQHEKYFSFN